MIAVSHRRLAARLPSRPDAVPRRRGGLVFERAGSLLPKRFRGSSAPEAAGRKAALAIAGAVAGGMLAPFPAVLAAAPLLGACGWRLPDAAAARRAAVRRREVADALPDLLDLLAICTLAGMGLDPALRLVAPGMPGPLGECVRAMLHAIALGVPRDRAYDDFARAAGADELRGVVSALRRAERFGSSVAGALAAQAAELRERRRIAAGERAHGAPVRMLFPLTLCFLPAFVLLTLAPTLIAAVQSFREL